MGILIVDLGSCCCCWLLDQICEWKGFLPASNSIRFALVVVVNEHWGSFCINYTPRIFMSRCLLLSMFSFLCLLNNCDFVWVLGVSIGWSSWYMNFSSQNLLIFCAIRYLFLDLLIVYCWFVRHLIRKKEMHKNELF